MLKADSTRPLYVALLAAVLALVGIVAANSAQADDLLPLPTCGSFFGGLPTAACGPLVAEPVVYGSGVPILPDPAKTPGAVATTDKAEICAVVGGLTYTKRHRVWRGQQQTLAKYGVPWVDHHAYEDDDRVPVCLGGDNANPLNHWPQPSTTLTKWGYEIKDWMDAAACRMVCHGTTPVEEAQGWFLEPDWRRPYCQLRPSDPLCADLSP